MHALGVYARGGGGGGGAGNRGSCCLWRHPSAVLCSAMLAEQNPKPQTLNLTSHMKALVSSDLSLDTLITYKP